MKTKNKLIFVSSFLIFPLVGIAFYPISKSFDLFATTAGNDTTWVHYARKEATSTEKGIREYWVQCGGGYQFTDPGVAATEATGYDVSGFTANDDRYIYPVTLNTQEVVMTDTTKSLNLGAYATMTVASMRAGTIDLGTNPAALDVSGFKADHSDDGARTVVVSGMMGGLEYAVYAPTTFVTAKITTIDQVSTLTHLSGNKKTIYGYYKLVNNLNFNAGGYTEFASGTVMYNTFAGTLDGNGKTITSKSRVWGLFPEIDGGTIKNVTITDGWSYGGIDQGASMLSLDMKNATIENVNFKMTAMANRSINTAMAISAQNYGWINSRICQDTSFKNCTFDGGTTLKIQTLVGTHSSCVRITFADCTMKCDSYFCLYQSSYTQIVTTAQKGITVAGKCVYDFDESSGWTDFY